MRNGWSAIKWWVWRRRKAMLYWVSAVSLAGNVVLLAESLQVRASNVAESLQQLVLPVVREVAEAVLQRRAVLYMLLNLIILCVLLKSGLLSSRKRHVNEGRSMQDNVVGWWSKSSSPSLSQLLVGDGELLHMSTNYKNSSNSVLLEPSRKNLSDAPNLNDDKQPKLRRASLFTIEPLLTAQVESTLIAAPYIDQEPSTPPTQHWYREGHADDYDLNRQEFNARVESFISKFKKKLSMQRQDSVNRLLSLVGKRSTHASSSH